MTSPGSSAWQAQMASQNARDAAQRARQSAENSARLARRRSGSRIVGNLIALLIVGIMIVIFGPMVLDILASF